MFAGDLESIVQPIFALGVGGFIGAAFVFAVAFSIGYIVYLQSQKVPGDH